MGRDGSRLPINVSRGVARRAWLGEAEGVTHAGPPAADEPGELHRLEDCDDAGDEVLELGPLPEGGARVRDLRTAAARLDEEIDADVGLPRRGDCVATCLAQHRAISGKWGSTASLKGSFVGSSKGPPATCIPIVTTFTLVARGSAGGDAAAGLASLSPGRAEGDVDVDADGAAVLDDAGAAPGAAVAGSPLPTAGVSVMGARVDGPEDEHPPSAPPVTAVASVLARRTRCFEGARMTPGEPRQSRSMSVDSGAPFFVASLRWRMSERVSRTLIVCSSSAPMRSSGVNIDSVRSIDSLCAS